ncbi:mucin-22-like [Haliotis asinina]|uniref:mucin-22-like n=1 Tax=Haliotis asinina TaxID=109174 RepID=UPI0035320011
MRLLTLSSLLVVSVLTLDGGYVGSSGTRFLFPNIDVFDAAVTTTLTVTTTSPTVVNVNISVCGEIFQIIYLHPNVAGVTSSTNETTTFAVALPSSSGTVDYDGKSYGPDRIISASVEPYQTVLLNSTGAIAGIIVIASQPVVVFLRGQHDVISSQNSMFGATEMLLPFDGWDTTFVGVPLGSKTPCVDDYYEILASLLGATVIINGSPHNTYLLSEQEVITVNNSNGEPVYIQSSDPVYVTHHCGTEQTSHFVLGTSHWTTTYTITPPPGTSTNYITIIAATASTAGVVVNPTPLSYVSWTAVPGTDFSYTTIPYSCAFISVSHNNCTERFGVYVYGSGADGDAVWSYAHPAGLRVATKIEEDANSTSCDLPVWVVYEETDSSSLLSVSPLDSSLRLKTSTTDSLSDYFLPIPSTIASNSDISFMIESVETNIPLESSGTMSISSSVTASPDSTIQTKSVRQTETGPSTELIQIMPSTFLAADLWTESSLMSASLVIVTTSSTASDTASLAVGVERTTVPVTDVFQSDTVIKVLIGTAVAVPACVTLVSLALWKGITKARTSSNFTLDESGQRTTVRSNVKQITVRSTNERLPRVQLVQKHTTMTSLRSHPGLDF